RSSCYSGRREQRNRKAQKPIGAEFQKNSREDNRTGSGRLHMRIRQPGMERKERNFYGEGKREGEKKPDLLMKGQRQVIELEEIEGQNLSKLRVAGCEIDDRHQHEQAPGH